MRMSRLFVDESLRVGQDLQVSKESSHYILNVLRLQIGATVTLFNGQGGEYQATLMTCERRRARLQVTHYDPIERESHLSLTLVQVVSRAEHMDFAIQKSVELGVHHIVPVLTARSVPLNVAKKRQFHWQKIIISTCEQCGRNHLPQLYPVLPLDVWLTKPFVGVGIVLSPVGHQSLPNMSPGADALTLLIGAEGGLSMEEITQATRAGYQAVSLGPRILRTETAALTTLAICQALWGDLRR